MFNKESSKKGENPQPKNDQNPQNISHKEDPLNPVNLHLFDLSPLSPILRTVKKTYQFSSPHCDLAMINTPLGINKQKSLIDQVDDQSHQKISMVLGFEQANQADEVDEYSSQYYSDQDQSSIIDQKTPKMEQHASEKIRNQGEMIKMNDYKMDGINSQEKVKITQKNQKKKPKPPTLTKKVTCNCKKTKCLKLYCDCFREGQYCDQTCNCTGCHNSDQYQNERNTSILSLLQRNPEAFKPKVQSQQHSKGCNCKKSGCLKKYCECFQAGLVCGQHCKCDDCKNCGQNYKNNKSSLEQLILK